MDQQKLRTLVFEKTGVRIDIDDPIFALVALNEAVLAEAVERHVALMDDASADLADQLQALQDSGSLCRFSAAEGGPGAAASARSRGASGDVAPPVRPAGPGRLAAHDQRMLMLAGGAALLCAVLVLAGQALFFKPQPPAASTVIARELTPEQALAIRDGEKLARIIQKLDTKTRNTIAAEMQKP